MTKNIFSTPRAKAHLQRNAFDLSRRDVFSCKAGQLLPVVTLECNPNEHFEIKPDIFLRTATLNTCAYARMKQKIEFFFVPYRSLWFKSDQFFTGTNYSTSSVYADKAPLFVPRFPLSPKAPAQKSNTFLAWVAKMAAQGLTNPFGSGDGLQDYLKLLDMLGYGCYASSSSMPTGEYAQDVVNNVGNYASLLRLAAYQKIYQDHYRLPLYEPYDNGCSLDDLQKKAETSENGIVYTDFSSNATVDRFFKLQYAPWKKDYFTNLRASSNLYLSRWMYNESSGNSNYSDFGNLANVTSDVQGYSATSETGSVVSPMNLSALNVRALFALEKLLDNMARAKDGSYNAQIEARFGVKPLLDPHLDSYYIGGADAPVVIGEVTATASSGTEINGETVQSALGQVSGKGTSSSSNRTITFDTKEHGVIMGIFSIVPESEYNATGIDPMLQKFSRPEFFTPEFDKLGFSPVMLREMFASSSVGVSNPYPDETDWDTTVLGFNPMYSEYKTALDKVHGDFISSTANHTGSLSAWVTPRLFDEVYTHSGGLSYNFLHINPAILDTIFAVSSDNADQFYVNCWTDIRAIRPMSVNGLPYCN